MSRSAVLEKVEAPQLKKELPDFNVGDTVRVSIRIVEGDKERIQVFDGIVIKRKGTGINESFTVYRVAYKYAMEKVFNIHSPKISKIEVVKRGSVKRATLQHLRGKTGKGVRVKEKIGKSKEA